jgi:hypothetical protein
MEAEDDETLFAFFRDHLIRVEVIGHERPFGAGPSEKDSRGPRRPQHLIKKQKVPE